MAPSLSFQSSPIPTTWIFPFCLHPTLIKLNSKLKLMAYLGRFLTELQISWKKRSTSTLLSRNPRLCCGNKSCPNLFRRRWTFRCRQTFGREEHLAAANWFLILLCILLRICDCAWIFSGRGAPTLSGSCFPVIQTSLPLTDSQHIDVHKYIAL